MIAYVIFLSAFMFVFKVNEMNFSRGRGEINLYTFLGNNQQTPSCGQVVIIFVSTNLIYISKCIHVSTLEL